MSRQIIASRCEHNSQWSFDVQPGEPLALCPQQEHRFNHASQTGIVDLIAQPGNLFFEIAIAVAGRNRQYLPLGCSGLLGGQS